MDPNLESFNEVIAQHLTVEALKRPHEDQTANLLSDLRLLSRDDPWARRICDSLVAGRRQGWSATEILLDAIILLAKENSLLRKAAVDMLNTSPRPFVIKEG